jgi:uncharacterized protein YbjT (DUF2867 family)
LQEARERTFVAGAAGFLGAAVVRRLVARGDEVVALARPEHGATRITRLGAVPVRGEITHARTLDQLLSDVDTVVHIAGAYRIGTPESDAHAGSSSRNGVVWVGAEVAAAAVRQSVTGRRSGSSPAPCSGGPRRAAATP